MIDQFSRINLIEALAARIVVLLTAEGLNVEEAKAVLAPAWVDIKLWGSEASHSIH